MEIYLSTLSMFSWQSLLQFTICLYVTRLSTANESFYSFGLDECRGSEQPSRSNDSLRAGRSGDRIPVGEGGDEIFRTHLDRPWGPPSLLYNGYRISFLGLKRPEHGVDHPPHLVPRLKREQSYTSTPHLGFPGLFQGGTLHFLYEMNVASVWITSYCWPFACSTHSFVSGKRQQEAHCVHSGEWPHNCNRVYPFGAGILHLNFSTPCR